MARQDERALDHRTLAAIRRRAVERVQAGESPEVVVRALETTFHEDPKVTICLDRRQAARRHERTRLRGTPDR